MDNSFTTSDIFLGIDLGTTSVCVSAVDKGGCVLKSFSFPTAAGIPSEFCPAVGDEQDALKIIKTVERCLTNFDKDVLSSVKGIGFAGQMHGVILWKGLPFLISGGTIKNQPENFCSPLYTWQDGRCDSSFLASLPQQQTHCRLSTGHGCATLFWLQRHHPQFVAQFDKAGTVMDLLVTILSGRSEVVMSGQNAASWSYYNCQEKRWNTEILSSAGFPVNLLPSVVAPGEVIGSLQSPWMGIPSGTRVTVGLGDTQAFAYSAFQSPTDAVINIGTSAQVITLMPSSFEPPPPNPSSPTEYFPFFKNSYMEVAAALNGGNALSTFVNTLASWFQQLRFGANLDKDAVFARLIELGMASQTSSVIIDPVLLGERYKADARGSISNIGVDNLDNLGSVFRSLCKGLILNLETMMPKASFRSKGIQRIVACGNALLKNPVLKEELEQVFELPVVYMEDCDAAKGAALVVKSTLDAE